jgi:regulator of protease activity HflC (stomatin/prohibitin superfamily)
MEPAFAWLGQIFEALLQFVPRRVIVRATERGVKWSLWREPKEMMPGIRFYWPLISDIEIVIVARQSFNTPHQPLQTQDGVEVVAGGVVVYSIQNVSRAIGKTNWSPEDTAQDIVQAVLAAVITSHEHEYILANLNDKIEIEITLECRKQLRKYGVRVSRAGLCAVSSTRNWHHSGIEINVGGE